MTLLDTVRHYFPVRYTFVDTATGKPQTWATVIEGTDPEKALARFRRLHPLVTSAEIVTEENASV